MRGTGKYSIIYMAALLCLPALAAEVDVGDGTNDNTYSDSASYAAATKIVKTGTGKTTLNFGTYTTNPGFTGEIEVQEGTLAVHGIANLGNATKITVHDGATLDLTTNETADPTNIKNSEIVIAGTGVNDGGALVRGGTKGINNLFKKLTLTANATVKTDIQMGITEDGTVNLEGFTLTKTGGGKLYCKNTQFKKNNSTDDPGNIVVAQGALFLHNGNALNGGTAKNTITLKDGATLQLRHTKPINWSVVTEGQAKVLCDDDNSGDQPRNRLLGPVSSKTLVVTADKANSLMSAYGNTFTIDATLTVNGIGLFTLLDTAVTNTSSGRVEVQNSSGIATLKLDGDTSMTAFTNANGRAQTRLYVAENSNRRGIIEIGGNSVVTNYGLSIGSDGIGAMYQRGGSTYWPITAAGWDKSGHNASAYGYLGITGGRFALDAGAEPDSKGKSVHFAAYGTYAMALHGGAAEFTASTNIGFSVCSGRFVYYQDGGTKCSFDTEFGFGRTKDQAQSGKAQLTVSGEGTELSAGEYLRLLCTNSDAGMIVNLNDGGILKTKNLYRLNASPSFYFNLNGGVIKPTRAKVQFAYTGDPARQPAQTTVYEGGFVIDTSECRNSTGNKDNAYMQFSFLAPGEGKRIASVALPTASGFASEKLVGSPVVTIVGDGQGASAFALFDDTTRTVTNIVVTSPGWGYTAATATLSSGGLATEYACAVTLEDQPSTGWKGFTKRGAQRLDMYGANTFNGDVTVEEGVLGFMATNTASVTVTQGGMPEGAGVTVKEDATLTFQRWNIAVTVPFLAGCGTTSYGCFTVTNHIECSAAEIFAGKHLTVNQDLTLSDGVKIVVTDPDVLAQHADGGSVDVVTSGRGITCLGRVELAFGEESAYTSPEKWILSVKKKSITLKAAKGIRVIFR